MFFIKCSLTGVPCFFLVEQDLWLIFTHSISFGVFPPGQNKPSLTSALQTVTPLWPSHQQTDFWLFLPLLCLLAQTSHIHDDSSIAIHSLCVSRFESGSGVGSACDEECCLQGQVGLLAAKKHTVPGFSSKRLPLLLQCPETAAPPSSDFSKHFQKLLRLQMNIFRYLG